MKNVGDLMKRLQKMMPPNVEPAFKTGEELLAWQKEQGEIRAAALAREKPGYENAAHIQPFRYPSAASELFVRKLSGRVRRSDERPEQSPPVC